MCAAIIPHSAMRIIFQAVLVNVVDCCLACLKQHHHHSPISGTIPYPPPLLMIESCCLCLCAFCKGSHTFVLMTC
ncbi:hypothetical protein JKP88DRAFT_218970 [Tribonema minus]|uniref:Secreted protein n=1 Tax=Tribonema minus TaxID=303371 RepID=A0A836CHW9_9STRA|nr:hypothetical protein JKP88DRAFT_218970 [Tribonema minus]